MSINRELFNEILERDGVSAAKKYLMQYEGMDLVAAESYVVLESGTTVHCVPLKEESVVIPQSYYCERDNILFAGTSICPECKGDVLKDECLKSTGVIIQAHTKPTTIFQKVKHFIFNHGN